MTDSTTPTCTVDGRGGERRGVGVERRMGKEDVEGEQEEEEEPELGERNNMKGIKEGCV